MPARLAKSDFNNIVSVFSPKYMITADSNDSPYSLLPGTTPYVSQSSDWDDLYNTVVYTATYFNMPPSIIEQYTGALNGRFLQNQLQYQSNVQNLSNFVNALYYNGLSWVTPTSLGTWYQNQDVDAVLYATDINGLSDIRYTIISKPTWITITNTTYLGHNALQLAGMSSDLAQYNLQIKVDLYKTIQGVDINIQSITKTFTFDVIFNQAPSWVTSSTLPVGTINQLYNTTIVATDPELTTITYTLVAGSLPPGITFNNGTISGTTSYVGVYNFRARATDADSFYTEKQFSVYMNAPPVWVTPSGSLPNGNTVQYYLYQLQATDTEILTYTLTSGTLPTGLSLSQTGVISGTPTTYETQSFTVTVSDGMSSVARAFSLQIVNLPPVWNTFAGALPQGSVAHAYSYQLAASDPEFQTVTYTLTAGSLPTGLSLSSSGLISGTPTVSANETFTVTATDGNTPVSREFSIQIINLPPVWSTNSGALTNATVGQYYSYQLSAYDPESVATVFTLTAGSLPTGLSLSSSGLISGTPTAIAVTSSFTITVSDNVNSVARAFSITVNNLPPVWNTSSSGLTQSYLNQAYSYQLSAYDPEGQPLTYTLTAGSLPTGLSLSSSGLISGTPTVYGSSTFTVTVSDSINSVPRQFSIMNTLGAAFHAIMANSKIAHSTDGTNWWYSTTPFQFTHIAKANNIFVGLGSGYTATSQDCVTWGNVQASPANILLTSIPGYFALWGGNRLFYRSTNGVNWTLIDNYSCPNLSVVDPLTTTKTNIIASLYSSSNTVSYPMVAYTNNYENWSTNDLLTTGAGGNYRGSFGGLAPSNIAIFKQFSASDSNYRGNLYMSTNSGITIGDISGIPSNIANHYYGRLSSYSLDATGAQYTWGTGDSDGLKAIFSLDFGSNTWYTYCTQDSGNTWAVPEAFPLGYRAKLYWGDNLFVGGDSTGKVATSTDASTWTVTTTLESSVVYMYYG